MTSLVSTRGFRSFKKLGVGGVGAWDSLPPLVWLVCIVSDSGEIQNLYEGLHPDALHIDMQNYLLGGGRGIAAADVAPVASGAIDYSALETRKVVIMW